MSLRFPWPNSLGLLYAAFTDYLGFQPFSDEWKVMGLGALRAAWSRLKDFVTLDNGFYEVDGAHLIGRGSGLGGWVAEHLGPKRVPESEIENKYKDVAFAVQNVCEQAMKGILRSGRKENRLPKALSGRGRGPEF